MSRVASSVTVGGEKLALDNQLLNSQTLPVVFESLS